MEILPLYISIFFVLITLATVFLFYKAANDSKTTLFILIFWLLLQLIIGTSGFYTITNRLPPKFLLLVLPPLILITALFVSGAGRRYLDQLNIKTLTYLHTIRIGVEIVLLLLSVNKTVPQSMTFEGNNFDILSGLSAPLICYFGYIKKKLSKITLLIWNFVCLGLLINIVITAILSSPSPFQQFAFDQPNIAILYFPFIWLPCCIVPLVFLSHLAAIRQLLKKP